MPKLGGYGIKKARLKTGGGSTGMGPFGTVLRAPMARRPAMARSKTTRLSAAARKRAAGRGR